jgi:hypothetical protein
MILPKARTENIVVQNLNGETLIYNLKTNQAVCLNETAAKVFEACDGGTSFEQVRRKCNFTDDLIHLALDKLNAEGLLEQDYASPLAGLSRREAIKRVGLTTLTVLPIISAIIAPTAANAASATCVANGTGVGNAVNPGNSCFNTTAPTASALCQAQRGSACCSGNAEFDGNPVPNQTPCVFACRCRA